jgi:transcriptional regulator of aromatic amino acid metabolism
VRIRAHLEGEISPEYNPEYNFEEIVGRGQRTFVRLNCVGVPSGLLESELFGPETGAFTGALMQKKGRFELADRGSLFLDEIGDINLELQHKLLRALQERKFERLGSTRTMHLDVRLIAASHRDLLEMIRQGSFREDLFSRLNVFPIAAGHLFRFEAIKENAKKHQVHPLASNGGLGKLSVEGQCQGIGKLHRARSHTFARRRIRSANF